jgi:signal transduction histidine kinase
MYDAVVARPMLVFWPIVRRFPFVLVAAVALPIVLWAVAVLSFDSVQFTVLSSQSQISEEGASAFARLFGALILLLFPLDESRWRLRWVAGGFVALGLGGFAFGVVPVFTKMTFTLAQTLYASITVSTLAGLFFVGGLWRPQVPRRAVVIFALAGVTICAAIVAAANRLPRLANPTEFASAIARDDPPFHALTPWHWLLSLIPLAFFCLATVAAAHDFEREGWGAWIVVAMTLLAGSQLHNLFWPSAYTSTLTSANVLRLAFAATIAVGGVIELRRVAGERAQGLAQAREYTDRLEDLNRMRADFASMAAHELVGPLAAIRRSTELLLRMSPRPEQIGPLRTIESESDLLATLVSDVRTSAAVERDNFTVHGQRVNAADLMSEAAAFARTVAEDRSIVVSGDQHVDVWADPARIGQVLRNLLVNASAYSPPGTTITLRAERHGHLLSIQVQDEGKGIPEADLSRVFDKYVRGRRNGKATTPGLGLGLYLSRRIVQAHGHELTVTSPSGCGAIFSFDLEIVE